jgi:hypothetical protein
MSLVLTQVNTFAQGTAITYQGRLFDGTNGAPTGKYDMKFTLYDALSGGNVVAITTLPFRGVTNGLFNVTLDFGPAIFTGPRRFLEIAVQTNGSAGNFTVLAPRQELTPVAYSITAENLSGNLPASQLTGTVPSASLIGTYSGLLTFNNAGNSFAGSFTGGGAGLTGISGGAISPASIPNSAIADGALSATKIAAGQVVKSLNGLQDAVTLAPGTNVVITTNGNTLTLASAGAGGSGIWSVNANNAYYNAGNVGIGTSNPGELLDVQNASGDATIRAKSTGSGGGVLALDRASAAAAYSAGILFQTGGGSDFEMGTSQGFAGNSDLSIYDYGIPGNVLTIVKSTGNLGIGTTTPDATLTVNGAADKPGGGAWLTFSDGRLKDVGANFTHGLEALSGIQPVHFHYKSDNPLKLPSKPEYIGIVAQQVERTVPEAVERNQAGYLVLNNDPIMWTMLNAIKELKAENDSLKHRLDQLEKRVTRDNIENEKGVNP